MSKKSRSEILEGYREEYLQSTQSGKNAMLNTFVELTGYSRKHAISLFNHPPTNVVRKRSRRGKLGQEAHEALIAAWHLSSRICAKRLVPFLPELISEMGKSGELKLSEEAKREVLNVSASTVDRELKGERRKLGRSPSTTKRAALVKSKVPVRTFTEWNDVVPGFFEIDTVSHSSSNPSGAFLSTLNMTDIATCWTESLPLLRKGAADVIAAMERAVDLMPFPLIGIDFDNGSEFLNEALITWCGEREITCTRSREYKKNDQAWIEEKNGSVVRKHVGRDRYEGRKTLEVLDKLYTQVRLFINFFQPSQKLVLKHRNGAKTYKKHDVAKTPYQRVMESPHVAEEHKVKLRNQRAQLSMVTIKAEITSLQTELRRHAVDLPNPVVAAAVAQRMAVHRFLSDAGDDATTTPRAERKSSSTEEVRKTLRTLPSGTIVTAKDFEHVAPRTNIDSCFSRLAEAGLLKRVSWGQYALVGNENHLPAEQ